MIHQVLQLHQESRQGWCLFQPLRQQLSRAAAATAAGQVGLLRCWVLRWPWLLVALLLLLLLLLLAGRLPIVHPQQRRQLSIDF